MQLSQDLTQRGLLEQLSDPTLPQQLDTTSLTVYAGFDPTADSLHIGSLMPILMLRRLQLAGHRPIALVGGATGLVGDPSGKAEERKLLSREEIEQNACAIEAQLRRFLDFSGPQAAALVNNADWFRDFRFLDFLRDVGKHFSLSAMLGKESVKLRLEREQGISYTEFSYMLVQAYDYLWLHDHSGCRLQIGATDQWGNITAGIEFIRRVRQSPAYGFTHPLVVNADGKKFGKTEAGNVWLDVRRTSPYQMYQFFLNVDDRDVGRYLRYFTFLSLEEIAALEGAEPGSRLAQRALAREVTTLVHGAEEAARAADAASALFSGSAAVDFAAIGATAPHGEIARARLVEGVALIKLLQETGLSPSLGGARRDIGGGGIYVNEERVGEIERVVKLDDLREDRFILLRKGKKTYYLLTAV